MTAAGARQDFDVIIAGGGMIGSAAAHALAPLGLRVGIVEAIARSGERQPSFDDRSTALSRSSQRFFAALGLWPSVEAASAPIRHIHVSDQGRFGFSHIDAEEQRVEALGHVVINHVLGSVLQESLETFGNVTELCPARIVGVQERNAEIVASVQAAGKVTSFSASLLVVADGAASTVRDILGVGATRTDYGQCAVVGNLRTERPIGDTAYERFTRQGPIAMLPMAGDRVAFVWTLLEKEAVRVSALTDVAFLEELQAAFGMRLGAFRQAGQRASYPLALSKAVRVTANRAVLVGNAAHGLHPVAAQGFNLGLRDVATLVDCIADALAGTDSSDCIGSAAVLDRYAAWRRDDQRKLVAFTDGLVRLFGSDRPPLRLLRDAGMLAFDLVPGIRREFARQTMGLAGRLPRLSRGVAPS